jgi:hypothetical protein
MDSAAGELVSQDPTQLPKSKAFALLDALEVRDFAGTTSGATTSGAVSAHPVAASVVRPDALRRDGGDEVMSVSEVKAIMDQLTVLRTLDERSTALSVAINFAYWKLGVSYQAFADVSLPTIFSPTWLIPGVTAPTCRYGFLASSSNGTESALRYAVQRT